MRSTRMRHAVGPFLVAALLVAGCGGGDQQEPAGDETTGAAEATSGEIDLAAFCTGAIEGEALFNAGPDLDEQGNPTEEGLQEFTEQLTPHVDAIEQNAPEEISGDVDVLVTAVRNALETGDPSSVESPEVFEADAAIDEYVFANCEIENTQELTAVEYEFQDAPESLPAGQVGIRLSNEGAEVHESVFLRINDDVDLSAEELLQLPEEEAMTMAEFRGVAFAGPGESGATVLDLEPGRYILACFIPVGTTSMDALFAEGGPEGGEPTGAESPAEGSSPAEDGSPAEEGGEGEGGPPHFTQGMFTEIEVG